MVDISIVDGVPKTFCRTGHCPLRNLYWCMARNFLVGLWSPDAHPSLDPNLHHFHSFQTFHKSPEFRRIECNTRSFTKTFHQIFLSHHQNYDFFVFFPRRNHRFHPPKKPAIPAPVSARLAAKLLAETSRRFINCLAAKSSWHNMWLICG